MRPTAPLLTTARRLLAATALLASATPATTKAGPPSPEASVLRVSVTSQAHNFRLPWQKESPSSQSALGALLEGNKVLVTAQVVANATYIELEKPTTGETITAEVTGVDYEANLALVEPVDPDGFFDGMEPLELTDDIAIGDDLEVWQFRANGSTLRAALELSRFDVDQYFLESSFFLVFEATGTLQHRDGSYSVPVTKDGRLAGLLLDYSSVDALSTILPLPIIRHFLDDLAQPPYHGFPNFGIRYAPMLDDQLRDFADAGPSGGIFVSSVFPDTSADLSGIKEGDVILEIDGFPVDSRGNYLDPQYGILSISHLVKGNVSAGDTIPVKILRKGVEIDLPVQLIRKDADDYLIDPYMFDRGPNYLIMGGMLFQELSVPFLETAGDNWRTRAPFKLVYATSHPEAYEEDGRRKLVVLTGVLPSKSTLGYEQLSSIIVEEINGSKINDLADLDRAFSQPGEDGVHRIQFTDYPKQIFLDHAAALLDNEILLPQRYRISQLKRIN